MLEQESPNIAPTPTLSQPGLLVMDVDSTLIDEEVIDQLGAAAGIGEQIASITCRLPCPTALTETPEIRSIHRFPSRPYR